MLRDLFFFLQIQRQLKMADTKNTFIRVHKKDYFFTRKGKYVLIP